MRRRRLRPARPSSGTTPRTGSVWPSTTSLLRVASNKIRRPRCSLLFVHVLSPETEDTFGRHVLASSGAFDAVIDFDKVVVDPAKPGYIKEEFDKGDHLHPNAVVYTCHGRSYRPRRDFCSIAGVAGRATSSRRWRGGTRYYAALAWQTSFHK